MKNHNFNKITHHYRMLIKQHEHEYLNLIREQFGIVIHTHQTSDLQKTILDACQEFNCDPLEYLKMLRQQKSRTLLLEHFISGITVGETYFFRDKHQIQLLKNTILPTLISKKRAEKKLALRIWSAGCASGEEIYTIAILLHELLLDFDNWTLHLMGTDINIASLRKAINGSYSEWSMRTMSDDYKSKYFTYKDQRYYLLPSILKKVSFSYLNLNDKTFPSIINDTNAQDLILCRNVLIYFDNKTINALMKKLSACLQDNGYLLLGASDPIEIKDTNLHLHYKEGTMFTRSAPEPNVARIKPLVLPQKIPAIVTTHTKKPHSESKPKVSSKAQIHLLLLEGRWQEVLDFINHYKDSELSSSFLLNTKAIVYANLGKLDQAVKLCQESLELDPTDIHLQFTLAMTLLELNELKAAEVALRKTLFLDHQFVMGHYELGLLLLRNKQTDAGIKSLTNALNIAKRKDPLEAVIDTQGLYYGRLAEILEHELEIHLIGREKNATHTDDKKQKV